MANKMKNMGKGPLCATVFALLVLFALAVLLASPVASLLAPSA